MAFLSLHYCERCGAAQQATMEYCSACGQPLQDSVRELLLQQRYRILNPVGQGGFGAVYKAEDTHYADRLGAIKEINLSNLTPQQVIDATASFNREVHLLSRLRHPNLPRIYDHFTDSEHFYLVLEFIEGENLEHYLEKTQGGHLSLEEVLDIGLQLCDVLDYLHTRVPPIIFRDLKPANVMRTSDGHLYLIDFGIARHFKPGQARDTMPLGSPGYAAPEQYGRVQTTPRADIYSLGAMLYQLLTGNDPAQTPFRFAGLQWQDHPSRDRLQSLLLQMVELEAIKRPTSIASVKQALGEVPVASRSPGTALSTYRGHTGLVLAVAWSPDGIHIASGSSDGSMHTWNATSGSTAFAYRSPFKSYAWAWALAWSPDGSYIATGSDDKIARVWEVGRNAVLSPMTAVLTYCGHSNWINAIAWSPDGRRIASASCDKTVQVWEIGTKVSPYRAEIYEGHTRWVETVAWSPDGSTIASGGNDATVHVWKEATKDTILVYRGHSFGVNSLAWSPDGTRIASCSWDRVVRIWDVATGQTVLTYGGHSAYVNTVAWSPDGTCIASAGKDNTVKIWNASTGKTLLTYRGHAGWVYGVAWSPDGTRIASAGKDKTVQVWWAR
jgi:WD40 repeat protein